MLFSLYRHPTQMMANQCNVILKIPLLKIRPNWQKQSSCLFTSVTDELNSVLLIKKHLQLVVIVRLKRKTQISCPVKRMSVYSLCQVYKFFFSLLIMKSSRSVGFLIRFLNMLRTICSNYVLLCVLKRH